MYLIKKKYVGKAKMKIISNEYNWYKNENEEFEGISYISQEAGYWRKANQIHKWFVDNCQDGVDNCEEHYVSKEKILELLDICKKIKEHCKLIEGKVNNGFRYEKGVETPIIEDGKVMGNPEYAEELLPRTSGFFFGSTDYDEYYMRDIDNTIEIIEGITDLDDVDLYYRSSW